MIYADNAATTQIDEDALNLMIELQKKIFRQSLVELQNFAPAEKNFK